MAAEEDSFEAVARALGSHPLFTLGGALALALAAVVVGERLFASVAGPSWQAVRRLWQRRRRGRGREPALAQTESEPTPDSYLGLHLIVGLGLALGAVALFTELAETVVERGRLTRFDLAFAQALREHATPARVVFFQTITWFGNVGTLVAIGVVVAIVLLRRGQRLCFYGWVAALLGDGWLNTALKHAFHRLRPSLPNPFVTETGWSFPSGHAMGALVTYGMLAYLLVVALPAERRGVRRGVVLGAVVLVVLIGFSRIYLTVHYFSDVLAGYAAGALWLLVCLTGVELARRHRNV
ncbi:MAG: phosphatase PAP2 family protein [Verrucomicrobia bacterium]|nr:phosphatase PAP2 family protein [Verrucomicrobiota bacterium]